MQRSKIDLHIHSTASDGTLSPSEVVHLALDLGLTTIALTDHDSLGGVVEAQAAAASTPLEVIPGVEINSEGEWGDIHFLGFYIDIEDSSLNQQLQRMQEARVQRARQMVQKLARMGMPLDWEKVRILAGGESVGRPHIAQALRDRGYTRTYEEAFQRYIGPNGPAYALRLRLTPQEAITAIHQAGGVAVLAHPAHSGMTHRVPELVSLGLQGLEVYYPDHSPQNVDSLLALCQQYDLLATGGSDFHSPGYHPEGSKMGSVFVPPECVRQLKQAAGRL